MMTVNNNNNNTFLLLIIVPLYISWRIYISIQMPISDCDEVYNYWEPLHYIMYGSGLQTWEYAHEYALRTYAYLLPLKLLVQCIETIINPKQLYIIIKSIFLSSGMMLITEEDNNNNNNDKIIIFITLRALLAFYTAICELIFIYAVSTTIKTTTIITTNNNNSSSNDNTNKENKKSNVILTMKYPNIYILTIILLTITGMNHSVGAYLPSSTWISVWCLCTTTYIYKQHIKFVIIAVIATLSIGWPFGAVCIVPMSIHILYKEYYNKNLTRFIITIIVITIIVQTIVMIIDYQYYGTWISPTFNIVKYNAGNSGDELYGIEPLSYYIKNLLLNLNLVAIFGTVALPIYVLLTPTTTINWEYIMILLSLPIWYIITLPRPHKEERFLFPIYPVLVFGSVLSIDVIIIQLLRIINTTNKKTQIIIRNIIYAIIWIPVIIISITRIVALQKYYTAPLIIYSSIPNNNNNNNTLICTCGEWYRFPSSFYLPNNNSQLQFLKSSFTGQLPQPFSKYGSKKDSQNYLQPFNDQNIEVRERYITHPSLCTYYIDLEDNNDCMLHLQRLSYEVIKKVPFLNADKTSSTSHRTLYIPILHEHAIQTGQVIYQNYILYKIIEKKHTEAGGND